MTPLVRRTAWVSIGVVFAFLICVATIQAQPGAQGNKDGQGGMLSRMQ